MAELPCQERIEGRPLRVAGGFPCWHAGRYLVAYIPGGTTKRVCGIHRRMLLRMSGWEDVSDGIRE